MAPSYTDPQNEREWIAAIARDLAHLRGDISDFREDATKRLERVETRVGDAIPDLAHRVHNLEETNNARVTRREAWGVSIISAAAAAVMGWVVATFTGHSGQ